MATLPEGCREAFAPTHKHHTHIQKNIRMKTHATASIRRRILAGAFVASASVSHAAIVITIQQVGANVVETGIGSANLSALTFAASDSFRGAVFPAATSGVSQAIVGPSSNQPVSLFSGVSGPTSYGTGPGTAASSGTGSTFGFWANGADLVVPAGYVSGAALSGSATFNGATFASLGMNTGTFTYTWGSGATADSLTLQVGPVAAAVPEPGSALAGMLALGACLSGLAGRSRRQTAEA